MATVAIFRYEKGHPDLINAALPLFEKYPLHLIFAGDGPLFEEVKADVAQRKLNHRVHCLGLREDIPNILAGCDIFCLPTMSEALGTAIIEAMHAKLPAIATDVDGVPEAVQHNETGLLFPFRDIPALRDALEKLILNPDLRHQMGEKGRDFALSRFGLETMANQMEEFYLNHLKVAR